jgi:hypothetical protein
MGVLFPLFFDKWLFSAGRTYFTYSSIIVGLLNGWLILNIIECCFFGGCWCRIWKRNNFNEIDLFHLQIIKSKTHFNDTPQAYFSITATVSYKYT